KSPLRYHGVIADLNQAGVVNFSLIGDASHLSQSQIPRRPNNGFGIDMAPLPHFCSETAQHPAPPGVQRTRAKPTKHQPNQAPNPPFQSVPQRVRRLGESCLIKRNFHRSMLWLGQYVNQAFGRISYLKPAAEAGLRPISKALLFLGT